MELARKKKFIIVALDSEEKIFVFYVASFAISNTNKVYSSCKVSITSLKVNEATKTISPEYSYSASVSS